MVDPRTSEDSSSLTRKALTVLAPILIIAGFVGLTFLIIKLNEKPEEKRQVFNPLAVMADYATREDIQLKVRTQGEARPRTEISLVPEVAGKIVYVSPNFIPGGIFQKGDMLIKIDDADYKIGLIRAQSGIAQAEQALAREVAEGEIARQDFAELGSGQPNDLVLRVPQRQQAEAALQAAKAELQAAELQLNRTAVFAPFTGRVRSKNSDVGQYVGPGNPLGQIFSTEIVEVRLPLSDSDLSKLNLPIAFVAKDRTSAPSVTLSASVAGQIQRWNGKIMRTDSAYDPQTRALYAIAEVFDPYGKSVSDNGVPLAPGLFVDAEILGKSFENVVVIPRDGLRPQNLVYVVDQQGKSMSKPVDVIDTDPDRAIIRSGLKEGELVVLSPMEASRTQMTLKVLDKNDPTRILVDPPDPNKNTANEANTAP